MITLLSLSLQAKQMLREADTNGDGRISRDEFNDLLKVSPFFHAAMSTILQTICMPDAVLINWAILVA